MRCTSGHENPDDARFCLVCGLALGTVPAVVPSPIYPPQPAYGPPPVVYGGGSMQPRNGMGTTALILGIIGLLFGGCILGPLAIIFGSVGISRANNGLATNKGAAVAGLVLGIIGTIAWLIIVAVSTSA